MADLRRVRQASPDFPEVLLVTLSDPAETEAFFEKRWPEVRAVSDPDMRIRAAFGIRRGGAKEFLAPGVWMAGVRALFKGNGVGKPAGDVRAMPGMLLVADGRVLFEQVFQHAGSSPDFDAVIEYAAQSRTK